MGRRLRYEMLYDKDVIVLLIVCPTYSPVCTVYASYRVVPAISVCCIYFSVQRHTTTFIFLGLVLSVCLFLQHLYLPRDLQPVIECAIGR